MDSTDASDLLAQLDAFHRRLESTFQQLATERSGRPVFALEHGLTRPALDELSDLVREQIRGRFPIKVAWLPFVVYATERGYNYEGEEYWQSFAEATPRWVEVGDREWVRYWFRKFAAEFNGAEPAGAWAGNRGIISWPITHAILPTDLQEDLAHLLFRARHQMTSQLLADADGLGGFLSDLGAHAYSSRFDFLLDNPSLLGLIAAALLRGGDGEGGDWAGLNALPLDRLALARIVNDLSRTVASREYLRAARSAAAVSLRGMRRGEGGTRDRQAVSMIRRVEQLPQPQLIVEEAGDGRVRLSIEVPDLTPLANLDPAIEKVLLERRCTVNGRSGAPLSREYFLYGRKVIPLTEWPDPARPLFDFGVVQAQLTLYTSAIESALARDQLLFLVGDDGVGRYTADAAVKPGARYLLLTSRQPKVLLPEIDFVPTGYLAYELRVPSEVNGPVTDLLTGLDLGARTELELTPVGVIPVFWDPAGEGHWQEDDHVLLSLRSTEPIHQLAIAVDGLPRCAATPETTEVFITLGTYEPGFHDVRFDVETGGGRILVGTLRLLVLERQARPSAYAAIRVLADPPYPSLTDVWDGKATLDVLGPPGCRVRPRVALFTRPGGDPIFSRALRTETLPITRSRWAELLKPVTDLEAATKALTDASLGVFSFEGEDAGVGRAELRCRRPQVPLRWRAFTERDARWLVLENDTDASDAVRVDFMPVNHPDRTSLLAEVVEPTFHVDAPAGLVRASFRDLEASAINRTAATRLHLEDLRELHTRPQLLPVDLTPPSIVRVLDTARLWGSADVFGDALSRKIRYDALSAIAVHLCSAIGGGKWAAIEHASVDDDAPQLSDFAEAVFDSRRRYDRALVTLFDPRWQSAMRDLPLADRIVQLDGLLSRHPLVQSAFGVASESRLLVIEAALRLASAPASLVTWSKERLAEDLRGLLDAPVILRAARYLVFVTVASGEPIGADLFGGWQWL